MIIHKQGALINTNAQRLSDPKISKIFDELSICWKLVYVWFKIKHLVISRLRV